LLLSHHAICKICGIKRKCMAALGLGRNFHNQCCRSHAWYCSFWQYAQASKC
jgi:uncharacterized protein (UPF0179 family)